MKQQDALSTKIGQLDWAAIIDRWQFEIWMNGTDLGAVLVIRLGRRNVLKKRQHGDQTTNHFYKSHFCSVEKLFCEAQLLPTSLELQSTNMNR